MFTEHPSRYNAGLMELYKDLCGAIGHPSGPSAERTCPISPRGGDECDASSVIF
jgi:hypothetical protein